MWRLHFAICAKWRAQHSFEAVAQHYSADAYSFDQPVSLCDWIRAGILLRSSHLATWYVKIYESPCEYALKMCPCTASSCLRSSQMRPLDQLLDPVIRRSSVPSRPSRSILLSDISYIDVSGSTLHTSHKTRSIFRLIWPTRRIGPGTISAMGWRATKLQRCRPYFSRAAHR